MAEKCVNNWVCGEWPRGLMQRNIGKILVKMPLEAWDPTLLQGF